MRLTRYMLLLAFSAFLPGCAPNLQMQYICNPAGATIYEDGANNIGTCPATVTYKITADDKQRGYIVLRPLTARWISGASFETNTLTAYLSNGNIQHYYIERPRNVAGYDIDASYAAQITIISNMRADREACEQRHEVAMGVCLFIKDSAGRLDCQANILRRPCP